jgi:hypothetical protein
MPEVTLHTGYGGLGDNLAYSSLPELYAEKGIDCYISSFNPYRNPGIKKFIWDTNPYIKGEKPLDRDDCVGHSYTGMAYTAKINSTTKNIEYLHGFEPQHEYPKLYIDYSSHELNGAVIVDITSITLAHEYANVPLKDMITNHLTANYTYSDDDIVFLSFPHINFNITDNRFRTYEVKDLFDYANILYGCKHYVSTHSGGNYLACTIKNEKLDFKLDCMISKPRYEYLAGNGNQALFQNCEYYLWG